MNARQAREEIAARPNLHAFISLTEETGEGTAVGVKDVVDVLGAVTTAGARILPAVPSTEDAPIIRAMRAAGCVVVGKTNLHEFAFGVTSINPHYGAVVNPRAPGRIAGGSSGGSAAAVAAGLVTWALGTDTGGSIRIPAALCGVVGFKPTIGTFDTTGVVPLSRSLDTLGPLAPDVDTAAMAFAQMQGERDVRAQAPVALSEFRLAVIGGWGDDLDAQTSAAWQMMTRGLPAVDFPARAPLNEIGFTILLAEAAAFHRHWLETVPKRYGKDVLEPLRRGLEVSRDSYVAALMEQARLRTLADAALESQGVDAVLVPATRIIAPRLADNFERQDLTGYTRPFNTTGQPVVCLPMPTAGVPIGIQLVGRHGQDGRLLTIAHAVENEWAALNPSLAR
jgi:Asp-tRNA(Asn)/Glu-tRNA(Gln) amidotransferase A subunit family amidase